MNSTGMYFIVNSVFYVLIGCRFIMVGLICLWNSCGMGCDTVAILGVQVVVCWDFRVLVSLRL